MEDTRVQIKALTAKLTALKYRRPLACLKDDTRFLRFSQCEYTEQGGEKTTGPQKFSRGRKSNVIMS